MPNQRREELKHWVGHRQDHKHLRDDCGLVLRKELNNLVMSLDNVYNMLLVDAVLDFNFPSPESASNKVLRYPILVISFSYSFNDSWHFHSLPSGPIQILVDLGIYDLQLLVFDP
jgi:hypothetical protein